MRLVYELDGRRVVYPIPEGETFIGRKDYCDLCFPDPSVSKRHVKLVRRGSRVDLFDAGSRNGTLLNGETVDRQELVPGDVIQIGKISLEFDDKDPGEASGDRAKAYRQRDDLSNEPSDEEMDRESRRTGSGGGRRDSFRDFDDFDASRSAKKNGRDEDEHEHRQTRASRAEARADDQSDVRDTVAAPRSTRTGSSPVDRDPAKDSKGQKDSKGDKPAPPAPTSAGDAPAAGGVTAKVTIVEGSGKGSVHALDEPTITIGSKEENAIVIRGEGVSRYHAEITREGAAFVLKDLGSRNGLFVGGKKVDVHELANGDEIQIGTIKLKFEVEAVKPKAFSLPKDPKALLKDERVKRALGAVILIVAAMLVLFPDARKPPPPVEEDYKTAVARVIADIRGERLVQAKEGAEKLKRKFPEKGAPRPLLDAITIWDEQKRPLSFRWEKAQATFDELKRDGGNDIGRDGVDWVDACTAFVKANFPWWKTVEAANGAQRDGDKARDSLDVPTARDKYLFALDSYKQIPKESCFFEHAETQAKRVRTAIFGLLRTEGQRRMKEARTIDDWKRAEDFLVSSVAHTEEKDALAQLREGIQTCQINQAAEKFYADAMEIITARKDADYPKAEEWLRQIDKRARCYTDAQGVIAWLGADMKVREARREYNLGNAPRAIQLLEEVLKVDQIGREAQETVRQRKELWTKVWRAFEAGQEAYKGRDMAKAERFLAEVVRLETSTDNRYNQLAKRLLAEISDSAKQDLASRYERGLNALNGNSPNFADAHDHFTKVLRDAGGKRDSYKKQIERELDTRNRRNKWLEKAHREFMMDQTRELQNTQFLCRLLVEFLPKTHEEWKKASELLQNVTQRITSKLKSGE